MILQSVCPLTIPEALDRAVAVGPDVEAIVASDDRLTFAELDREVSRLIVALCAKGIRPGDRIAICLGNSARWVSLFLALGSIGAVTVPINTRFVADEFGYALRQSRVKGLFIVDRFLQIDFVSMLRSTCPGIDASLPDSNLPDLQFVVVIGKNVPKGATSFVEFVAASAEHHSVHVRDNVIPKRRDAYAGGYARQRVFLGIAHGAARGRSFPFGTSLLPCRRNDAFDSYLAATRCHSRHNGPLRAKGCARFARV
jgi:hypothetical protein